MPKNEQCVLETRKEGNKPPNSIFLLLYTHIHKDVKLLKTEIFQNRKLYPNAIKFLIKNHNSINIATKNCNVKKPFCFGLVVTKSPLLGLKFELEVWLGLLIGNALELRSYPKHAFIFKDFLYNHYICFFSFGVCHINCLGTLSCIFIRSIKSMCKIFLLS